MRWAASFLVVSILVVGGRFALARVEPDFDDCVRELVDGDADGAERWRCLERIRDRGLELARDRGPRPAVLAAMAAVLLRDEAGFEAVRASGLAGGYLPGGPAASDVAVDSELALGEDRLADLLRGFVAENRGDAETARDCYRRASVSAELTEPEPARRDLSGPLAARGLERLR